MFCLSGNAKYLRKYNDTKRCFRQKWYGIARYMLNFYLLDLEMIVKQPVKATLKFLYEYLHFLLYIFVADSQISSKHYKLLSSVSSTMKI